MKIVFDSNVLLAAFATRGLCEALFTLCVEAHDVIISEAILSEVEEHLVDKFDASTRRVEEVARFLKGHCIFAEPTMLKPTDCRDPDDLPILGTAVASRADVLVSGDKDLLVVKRFQGTLILSPRQLYERLR